MSKNKAIPFEMPGENTVDPLTNLLRSGARKLITDAVEVELQQLLGQYAFLKNEQRHRRIVRYGYLPKREIQMVLGLLR